MIAEALINPLIKELKPADTCSYALDWMMENSLCHLPVVERGKYLGILSEEAILDLSDDSLAIEQAPLHLQQNFVWANTHLYDVVKITANSRLTIIPVMDRQVNYRGVISVHDLYKQFAQVSGVVNPGGILVLAVNSTDYMFSEIARLVESCNAKIISCHAQTIDESTKLQVTLKLNLIDLSEVIETFERFDYKIEHAYHEHEGKSDLNDRFENLMNYLNI